MKAILRFTVLALTMFLLSACGSSDTQYSPYPIGNSSDQSILVSVNQVSYFDSIDSVNAALLKGGADKLTVSNTLGGYDTINNAAKAGATTILPTFDILKIIETVWNNAGFTLYFRTPIVNCYKITYKIDNLPNTPNLTGLLMLPFQWPRTPRGILLFTHPTEVLRKYSPSVTEPFIDGTFTKLFGYLFGTLGYAVVIPDYPGLGDNYETHPYCLTSLGKASAAMVKAVKDNSDFGLSDKTISIIGFSEGGYAALASAYYMRNYPGNFKVDKVVSLSGPYDLSNTMKKLMINADTTYPAPYFLPYVINGYHAAYPKIDYLDFSKSVVEKPVVDGKNFNTRLLSMLSGDYDGSQISSLIYTVIPDGTKQLYYGPLSVATTVFQDQLVNKPESDLNKALLENTLARQDWFPDTNVKFLFAHFDGDDCVPYGNTEAISNVWKKYSNVTITKFTDTDPLSKGDVGSTHAASIVKEYIAGMKFILGM